MKLFLVLLFIPLFTSADQYLPKDITFIGSKKFHSIWTKAKAQQWQRLPLGQRMQAIAMELEGVRYQSHTLEIHDLIESPSVNFDGLDCWTFFETVLGIANMMESKSRTFSPDHLLHQIEHTRYRKGQCKGQYLDRLHYLVDWFQDNHDRKNILEITDRFPTVSAQNQCNEMTQLWKHYRYLKHSPKLRQGMKAHEERLTKSSVRLIPKHQVKSMEHNLQAGDIVGIVRHGDGSYCSHVGIIVVDQKGVRRFMHASTTYQKVVVDSSISDYL